MLKDEDLASLSARGAGDKVDEDTSYEGIMKSAGVCMIRNDLEGSRRLFRKAIKLDPDNPLAHHNLATVYSNSGHYVGAVNEFVQCVFSIESNGLMYEPYGALGAFCCLHSCIISRPWSCLGKCFQTKVSS